MASRPCLLMLSPDFPPAPGGIQLLAHRLATHIDQFDVSVVTLAQSHDAALDDAAGIPVRRVPRAGRSRAATVGRLNAAAVAHGARHRPDVVLSMHMLVSPAARVLSAALGIPYFQYLHAAETSARPRLAAWAVRAAAGCVAVSRHAKGLALAAGAPNERVHLIPPGVDLPSRRPRGGPRLGRTVVTVARMEEWYKGHDVLVRAMPLVAARAPGAEWIVIGDGPLRPHLEHLAHNTGAAATIRFLGAVSDRERDSWLERATVFAMPSRTIGEAGGGEGFGIVYLEAGAHGLPVVAGDAAGARDAVRAGETGVLVDPRDHVAVADALAELLLAPAHAGEMGARGREWAREHSWPRIARRVEAAILGAVHVA